MLKSYQFFQRKRNVFLFCIGGTLCLVYLFIDYQKQNPPDQWFRMNLSSMSMDLPECADSLSTLLNGRWIQRNLTFSEESEMEMFLYNARNAHHLPPTLQRSDLKCGNVTFDWLINNLHPLLWFRALCNPKGDKPCCYNGMCVQASVEQCRCEQCYDMRQQIHAEYSTWVPSNHKCHLKVFTREHACRLLEGGSIEFIGDSFVRHLYTAMLILLTDDPEYGALLNVTSSSTRAECRGMYMFTESRCRLHLNRNATVCGGTVSLNMREQVSSAYGKSLSLLAKTMANTTKSLLIIGIGIHENYNPFKTTARFLKPLLNQMYENKQKMPRILWAGPHAPGLLKTPRIPQQEADSVLRYNAAVNEYLTSWRVPFLDTFNMTKGVMSFDGAHYGIGVNLVKAKIVLSYIQELDDRGVWL